MARVSQRYGRKAPSGARSSCAARRKKRPQRAVRGCGPLRHSRAQCLPSVACPCLDWPLAPPHSCDPSSRTINSTPLHTCLLFGRVAIKALEICRVPSQSAGHLRGEGLQLATRQSVAAGLDLSQGLRAHPQDECLVRLTRKRRPTPEICRDQIHSKVSGPHHGDCTRKNSN